MSTNELVLLPEDEELGRLKARLSDLEDALADRELEYATLRGELNDFQARYLGIVGKRMAELDALEAEIAAVMARMAPSPEAQRESDENFRRARESAEALGDDPDALAQAAAAAERIIPPDLKTLFRKVAKAVHPDLAVDDADRELRERLMAEANAAYADGDFARLQAVLDDWSRHPQAVAGEGTGAELVRVIRAIAAVEARLAELGLEMTALGAGSLEVLRQQVRDARAEGRDLLQEMATELDSRIAAARTKLAGLREAGVAESR